MRSNTESPGFAGKTNGLCQSPSIVPRPRGSRTLGTRLQHVLKAIFISKRTMQLMRIIDEQSKIDFYVYRRCLTSIKVLQYQQFHETFLLCTYPSEMKTYCGLSCAWLVGVARQVSARTTRLELLVLMLY